MRLICLILLNMPSLDVWGPNLWKSIHYIALGYPKKPTFEDKLNYKNFYLTLGPVLPCMKCSMNFKRHMNELPIDGYLENTDKLFAWTVKLHNIVNKENGKGEMSVSHAKEMLLGGGIHDLVNRGAVVFLVVLALIGIAYYVTRKIK